MVLDSCLMQLMGSACGPKADVWSYGVSQHNCPCIALLLLLLLCLSYLVW